VPGASVALVHNGEVAERRFGVALMTNAETTNADRAQMPIAELLARLVRACGQDLFPPAD
jgi:hypothetical protein